MRKKYMLLTGILIALSCGITWALYLYNKPHTNVGNRRPVFTMDAASLYREYSSNEAGANQKFVDKVIEVTGTVAGLEQTDSTASILLNTGDPAGVVNCGFLLKSHEKISFPSKGSPVTIKGKCTGFLNDVNMVDCVME